MGNTRRIMLGAILALIAPACRIDEGGLSAADPALEEPADQAPPAPDPGRASRRPPVDQPPPPLPEGSPPLAGTSPPEGVPTIDLPPPAPSLPSPSPSPPVVLSDAGVPPDADVPTDANPRTDGAPAVEAEATAPLAPAPREPLLWFTFDDPAGRTTALDRSGFAQHALLRGVDARTAWIDGRLGGALDLRAGGRDGHLLVPRSTHLDRISDRLSLAAWIRLPAEQDPGIIVTRAAAGGSGLLFRLEVKERRLKVQLAGAGPDSALSLESDRVIPTRRWVHVAMIFDGKAVRLFLDGERVGSAAHPGRLPPSGEPLIIGAGAAAAGDDPRTADHLPGSLDELLVYGRPLLDREVATLAAGERL